ncbi:DDHD domain [Popillia japonica]|uniref:DDHD domain n=1 Tax=Popillia japonica TaxID=7064 RepID=A0AAW1J067_POPJA
MFGSPLALVLAYRQISSPDDKTSNITRPMCNQIYNMFHPTDPVASRLEPLLSARFSLLPPVNVARYTKYPLGNGQPHHLVEVLQANTQIFNDMQPRRLSEVSLQSTVSGIDDIPLQAISALQQKWWGNKRMDYALYCPEGLSNFPTHAANDVIVKEGLPQTIVARFMYGPLDMITLTGEKVDIHVMRDVPSGEWSYVATEVTDKTGRVTFTFPEDKSLNFGLYPLKMVVRGDHTSVDFFMAVVPPKTECVVFSIDGSFTASMSVTGRDPKVRAGAVDVVRHWQELGYLIIYTTGRPDMQHHRVVSWLSQHNFPHGLVSFADGLSTDPLGHKTTYLNNLIHAHGVIIQCAYGSSKDITVYTSIGLKPKQIFIVGKASKKQHSLATVLSEGYAAHLATLLAHGGSRPAQGNARMVIPRGYFGLPGQVNRRRSAKRTSSYPANVVEGNPLERTFSVRRYQLPKTNLPLLGTQLGGG